MTSERVVSKRDTWLWEGKNLMLEFYRLGVLFLAKMGRLTVCRVKILGMKCDTRAVLVWIFCYVLLVISWGECYDGVIVI